jgi:ATP-dependent Clp protease ATP-binding subunit ClpB
MRTGVGKTAVVEGLAQRIVSGDVPPGLLGASLLELDIAALAAGCMMPGEFEVSRGGSGVLKLRV